jgi:hypothetical protein
MLVSYLTSQRPVFVIPSNPSLDALLDIWSRYVDIDILWSCTCRDCIVDKWVCLLMALYVVFMVYGDWC